MEQSDRYKVSVLVPVYGVERYIGRCAESLMRQTYANIEYIFVDDCTPDSSIDVIRSVVERYPDRKNNVRILCHDENRGLAAVRNTAVSAATGAFVLHVDSDDWVEPDIVERLVEHQAATGADIVGCGHTVHRRGVETDRIETYDGIGRDLSQLMLRGEAMFYVWGRLIRRSLYTDNAVRCVEGANGSEDMLTVCKLTYYAQHVSYIDAALYHYNLDNEGSFCHTFSEAKNMQDWVNRDELRRYFADKGSRYVEAIDRENRRYAARTILTAAAEPGHRAYIQVMRKRANVATPPPKRHSWRLTRCIAHQTVPAFASLCSVSQGERSRSRMAQGAFPVDVAPEIHAAPEAHAATRDGKEGDIQIAFCLDDGYAAHCATVMASVMENNKGERVTFHLLSDSLGEENKQTIEAWTARHEGMTARFYHIDSRRFEAFSVGKSTYLNISTYFRLILPELLPDLDKVIYLDCDTLVCGSLRELWNIDISRYALAGVRDRINDYVRVYNRLDYPMTDGYVNAGVLLINLHRWREDNVLERAVDIAHTMVGRLHNHDQDIINKLYHGEILFLSFRWNVLEWFLYEERFIHISRRYYAEIERAIASPTILHYCTPAKPWNTECVNPFANLYAKYRAMTPWPTFKVTRRSHPTVKQRFLTALKRMLALTGLYTFDARRTPLRANIYKVEDGYNVLW